MIKSNVQYVYVESCICINYVYSSNKKQVLIYLLDDVCVLPHSCNAGWLHQVPVLQAVVEHTTVKRVVVTAVFFLKVPIAVVVGLLIGCDVTDDHIELWQWEKGILMTQLSSRKTVIFGESGKNKQALLKLEICMHYIAILCVCVCVREREREREK